MPAAVMPPPPLTPCPRALSPAAPLQAIKGARQWVTNEYRHSAIRDDGARVFDKLLAMARDMLLLD
jgi:hypothetical protein